MQLLLAILALATVSLGEVQIFKHVGDHQVHTHEHHEGSARRRDRRNAEVA